MSNQTIRFIRKREVMHMTGLPSSTIYDLMNRDLFPAQLSLGGGKSVAWLESDVMAWMNERIAASKAV